MVVDLQTYDCHQPQHPYQENENLNKEDLEEKKNLKDYLVLHYLYLN
jgi:hypothetical protein